MAEASAAGVYHYAHLTYLVNAHFAGRPLVEDLVNHLNLRIVVTGAQGAQLEGRGVAKM